MMRRFRWRSLAVALVVPGLALAVSACELADPNQGGVFALDSIRIDPVSIQMTGAVQARITKAWLECYRPGAGEEVIFTVKDYSGELVKDDDLPKDRSTDSLHTLTIQAFTGSAPTAELIDDTAGLAKSYTNNAGTGITIKDDFHAVSLNTDLSALEGAPIHITGTFTCAHGFTTR